MIIERKIDMNKETNLEHYKEELKNFFCTDYLFPQNIILQIERELDRNIKYGYETGNKQFTGDILDWMAQPYKESVLDKVEKEYLGEVIKPFRSRVVNISLCSNFDKDFIRIWVRRIDESNNFERIELPYFKTGTMYKGMEVDKHYTLKELGL